MSIFTSARERKFKNWLSSWNKFLTRKINPDTKIEFYTPDERLYLIRQKGTDNFLFDDGYTPDGKLKYIMKCMPKAFYPAPFHNALAFPEEQAKAIIDHAGHNKDLRVEKIMYQDACRQYGINIFSHDVLVEKPLIEKPKDGDSILQIVK